MSDDATPAKVRLTDVLGPWAPAPARTQWGAGMVEALVGIGRDETARIYADKAAAPLVAEAIFADYVRGRLAALRDHYAAQGRPASEEALLFAAIADCEMAILGPNALPLWQEVQRLKDALEPQSPTTADGPAALELSCVPLNKRDLNWHAHATTQLRAMHAALREDNERLRAALQWIDGATAATPGLTDAELGRAMAAIGKKARDALGA